MQSIFSKNFFKKNAFLIFLFIISLALRAYRLDKFPIAMIHDELNYVMNAKSLYHTGKNIPLTATALLSWGEKDFDVVISELPSLIIVPWVGPNILNQFNSRILYVLISSFSVVLLYLIVKILLSEPIANYASLVFALNPWSIHIGRTALEVNFSIIFFLLGVYFLIRKNASLFLSFTFFVAMFMTYLGAKLNFVPLIVIFLFYKYYIIKDKAKVSRKFLMYFFASLAVLLTYTLSISGQPSGERTDELIIFERDWAASLVNDERRQAIPNTGLEIFSNKATVIIKRVLDVYLKAFSTTGLFSRGETVSVYSTWEYGQFHYIDFALIIMGLIALFAVNRKVFWLVAVVLAISPIVSSIDLVEHTYAIRAYPMFPFLAILSGVGFWYIRQNLRFGKIVSIFIGVVYIGSILFFLNLYLYRYPVYAAERWFFSERIIANYVKHSMDFPEVKKIYVSTVESPKITFENLLFYMGLYNNKEQVEKANVIIKSKDFTYEKLTVVHGCPQENGISDTEDDGTILITHRRFNCLEEKPGYRGIVDLKDAGTVFVIRNDKLCEGLDLQRYYRPMDIGVFDVEKLSTESLCKNWIISF
jgi:hypothetical protein